jgi:hypothetical protein
MPPEDKEQYDRRRTDRRMDAFEDTLKTFGLSMRFRFELLDESLSELQRTISSISRSRHVPLRSLFWISLIMLVGDIFIIWVLFWLLEKGQS